MAQPRSGGAEDSGQEKSWISKLSFVDILKIGALLGIIYILAKAAWPDLMNELEKSELRNQVSSAQAETAKKDQELKEQIKFQEYLKICSGEMYFSPQMQAEIRRVTQIYDSNQKLILSQTSADPSNTWTKPRLERKLKSCEELGGCSTQDVEIIKYWLDRYSAEEDSIKQAIAKVVKNTEAFGLIEFARPRGVDSIARILAKRGIKVELEIRSLNRAVKIEFNPDNPESDFSKRTEFILEAIWEGWKVKDQYQDPRFEVRFVPNSLDAGGVKTQGRDPFNPDPAHRN